MGRKQGREGRWPGSTQRPCTSSQPSPRRSLRAALMRCAPHQSYLWARETSGTPWTSWADASGLCSRQGEESPLSAHIERTSNARPMSIIRHSAHNGCCGELFQGMPPPDAAGQVYSQQLLYVAVSGCTMVGHAFCPCRLPRLPLCWHSLSYDLAECDKMLILPQACNTSIMYAGCEDNSLSRMLPRW